LINVPDSKMRVDVSDHDQFELKATGATVVRGEDIIITCPVFGYPMPKITWKKDDHDIVNDKHVTVKNNQVVILESRERTSRHLPLHCSEYNLEEELDLTGGFEWRGCDRRHDGHFGTCRSYQG